MFSRHQQHQPEDPPRCSFCRKPPSEVGKLISNPSDYPRAYICDERIFICTSILDDERAETTGLADPGPRHPAFDHALAPEVMKYIVMWVRAESLGQDGLDELGRVRETAKRMVVRE